MPFEYHAKVNKVIDGDTINVDLDLGFNVVLSNQSVYVFLESTLLKAEHPIRRKKFSGLSVKIKSKNSLTNAKVKLSYRLY